MSRLEVFDSYAQKISDESSVPYIHVIRLRDMGQMCIRDRKWSLSNHSWSLSASKSDVSTRVRLIVVFKMCIRDSYIADAIRDAYDELKSIDV